MGLKREANDLAYIVCLNDKRDGKNYTCGYCQGRKPGQNQARSKSRGQSKAESSSEGRSTPKPTSRTWKSACTSR